MYDPQLALVPMSTNAIYATSPIQSSSLTSCSLGVAGVLSIALFLVGLPLVAMGIIAIAGMSTLVAETTGAARRERLAGHAELTIPPEGIVPLEVRDSYRATLHAYADLQHVLSEAPQLQSSAQPMLDRCHAAVELCGRMAVFANPLHRYLETHDPAQARAELDRLRARIETTTDAQAIGALGNATAARMRQLAVHDQITALRDRIHARLELVRATLESFSASVVKLHVEGEEQMILAGESVMDHLDGVRDELEVLESALAMDLAA